MSESFPDRNPTTGQRAISSKRRRFLFALGATGAGAAAVAAAPGAAATVAPAAASDPAPSGSGYRVTDHIRDYYDSTRF
jgi:hypothetical protein